MFAALLNRLLFNLAQESDMPTTLPVPLVLDQLLFCKTAMLWEGISSGKIVHDRHYVDNVVQYSTGMKKAAALAARQQFRRRRYENK